MWPLKKFTPPSKSGHLSIFELPLPHLINIFPGLNLDALAFNVICAKPVERFGFALFSMQHLRQMGGKYGPILKENFCF